MIDLDEALIRPPVPGESLYGYLAEITAAQGLDRIALLSGETDREHGHRPSLMTGNQDELPGIAGHLGMDVAELEIRSHPILEHDSARRAFFGTTIARADLRPRVRFFSPAALATKPYHRAMWLLRIPFDSVTGEILVSDCGLCGRIQRWRHTAGVDCCDGCGESLVRPVERIDLTLLPEVSAAIGLTHSDPAIRSASLALLPPAIQSIGADQAFELLLRLVPVAEPHCTWRGSNRIWNNDPHAIARGMHGAWRLLEGWPRNMADKISHDIATAGRRFADGNGGATIGFLRLREAEYLAPKLRDVIRRLHESIDVAGHDGERLRAETMTSVEVARVIGGGTKPTVELRRKGAFRTIGVARGAVLVPAFSRAEVRQVVADISSRLDLNQVSAPLGLPYYAVEQLSALGRLPLLEHPYFALRYSVPQTATPARAALVSDILSGRTSALAGAEAMIDLMHMVGGRLKPWDAVIEAMLTGNLLYDVAQGRKPLFQRVRVRRVDLAPLLAMPLTRNGARTALSPRTANFEFSTFMTKRDAAEVLNLSVRQGTEVLRGYSTGNLPLVPIADVEALARRFVTNIELAVRIGVPHQRVRRAARILGAERTSEAGYERSLEAALIDVLTQIR